MKSFEKHQLTKLVHDEIGNVKRLNCVSKTFPPRKLQRQISFLLNSVTCLRKQIPPTLQKLFLETKGFYLTAPYVKLAKT